VKKGQKSKSEGPKAKTSTAPPPNPETTQPNVGLSGISQGPTEPIEGQANLEGVPAAPEVVGDPGEVSFSSTITPLPGEGTSQEAPSDPGVTAVESTYERSVSSEEERAVESTLEGLASRDESCRNGEEIEADASESASSLNARSVSSIFPEPGDYPSSEEAIRQYTMNENMFLPEEFSGPRKMFRRTSTPPRHRVAAEPRYFPGWFSDTEQRGQEPVRGPTRLIEFPKVESTTPIEVNAIVVEITSEVEAILSSETGTDLEVPLGKGKSQMEGERPNKVNTPFETRADKDETRKERQGNKKRPTRKRSRTDRRVSFQIPSGGYFSKSRSKTGETPRSASAKSFESSRVNRKSEKPKGSVRKGRGLAFEGSEPSSPNSSESSSSDGESGHSKHRRNKRHKYKEDLKHVRKKISIKTWNKTTLGLQGDGKHYTV
jgi:hypothetical protein